MEAFVQSSNTESGKMVLQACVPFLELYKSVRITKRSSYLDFDEDEPIEINEERAKKSEYQRNLDEEHLNDIVEYLKKTITGIIKGSSFTAIFPTSLLIATNLENTPSYKFNKIVSFEIEDNCWIVDGQHRFFAMKKLYEDEPQDSIIRSFIEKYCFNCSILVNFDIWEQALLFADVNFNQKKVSKSLYFDIFGMLYFEDPEKAKQNAIYISHSLVLYLNTSKYSPLKGLIKMLGNKEKGLVSQSFLVEALLRHTYSRKGIWKFDPYSSQKLTQNLVRHMAVELLSYLTVFSQVFSDIWPTTNFTPPFIICKTTGLGAILRLLEDLHLAVDQSIIDDVSNQQQMGLNDNYIAAIKPYIEKLLPYKNELFEIGTKESPGRYAGAGGQGLINALYNKMIEYTELPVRGRKKVLS